MSESVMDQTEQGMERYFFRASAEDFKKIPGSPVAYWIKGGRLFEGDVIGQSYISGGRNKTHDNAKYVRYFWEVDYSTKRWVSYANGGDFRKYFGNETELVDWSDEAQEFYVSHGGLCNQKFWWKDGVTWSLITSAINSFRVKSNYSQYSSAAPTIFNKNSTFDGKLLAFLNSPIAYYFLKGINPTLNTTVGDVLNLPFPEKSISDEIECRTRECIEISKIDWNSQETSQRFASHEILDVREACLLLDSKYEELSRTWKKMILRMQELEYQNNYDLIGSYGLQKELTPDVPLEEITLTCNPHYRYGGNKTDEELEALLLQDTMAEFCSYAVGCMFGRYSLDKPGLVLANQGETLQDYLQQVPQPSFRPDEDNVIPLLDADWFADDVTGRFLEFLRLTFGTEHFAENLAFVERGLNIKNKRNYSIRDFFVKEFYDYHVRMYKKRPIYWLFASPRGTFQALVYLHRYRPDTVSVVLRYLREFRDKLAARRQLVEQRLTDASASQGEKTRLTKELEQLRKQILELDDYEHDVLFPLAGQRLEIDLDDGVKANYPRFGKALQKVAGLS